MSSLLFSHCDLFIEAEMKKETVITYIWVILSFIIAIPKGYCYYSD